MSFKFSFADEDVASDDASAHPPQQPPQQNHARALDSFKVAAENQPQMISFSSMLQTLANVRVTFDNYTTPGGNTVYRRELFDVKHQVMTEENTDTNAIQLTQWLIDDNRADLQSRVYEGGFKSWECSYDLVDKLSSLIKQGKLLSSPSSPRVVSILEMGCGTALPASFLVMKKFQARDKSPMKLVLSDFNLDALRLVTIPNLLIHWCSTLPVDKLRELTTSDENPAFNNDEVFVSDKLIHEFEQSLNDHNVEIVLVSGSWGSEFNALVKPMGINFILSSETIYSPETLPIVAESLWEILADSGQSHACALVAAKNIYFGVGGSVVEFLDYFDGIKNEASTVDVEEIDNSQLKRSIISIEYISIQDRK
ncbi:uncharacterized protein LODBEIA_P07660 [Lodderomyces beijingensis]|uniref:protein-histidine N-methyltransferase n=1 Tax=Lodderomyces beijingensis TaxID=1775926 RepID=A0ABP0ZK62_9ASCO